MNEVFRQNIALQKRIDHIKTKGTGIANLGQVPISFGGSVKSKTPLPQPKFVGNGGRFTSRRKTNVEVPSEFFIDKQGILRKNSLNFFQKKKEGERVRDENQKMAGRILS
jgi:hypothetical protein